MNFRALLTRKENDTPMVKDVNISIYDGNDNKVYNENVKTSEYGILSGSFKLANEVNSGIYKLIVKTDTNETTKSFKVNPYVLPKYEVKIDSDKENYLVGERANINLEAKYFFGEPVSGAKYTVYVNDRMFRTITADQQGKATFSYPINYAQIYSIKVEATDSSNYFVEATKNLIASTDVFELELLPEYGTLAAGKKNDVYVFTTKPDGSPLKTYVTVSSDNFRKQIVTDENGIGRFAIDVDSISENDYYNRNNKNKKSFNIIAENMSGDEIQKTISLDVETKNLLVSTNKLKYEQGEDIKISLDSPLDNTKNIYIFKADKLIKMLSTDSSETDINLGDEYGLIDIYVTQKRNSNYYGYYYYYDTNSYKKTIFVKPEKELNISIDTDKTEYKPGEKITISFGTTDENANNVDSALLVSMLDNAVLSLADNDLSIDNIKLALSELVFSDELDAATLYSCIVDDKSEQTLSALLLKQSSRDISVSESTIRTYAEEEKAAAISIISIIAIIIIVLIYFSVKSPKFRNTVRHIINAIAYIIAVVLLAYVIIDEFFWRAIHNEELMMLFFAIVALATYVAWVSKLIDKMFKTTIMLMITPTFIILMEIFEENILIIVGIFILILAILSKINERKNLKFSKQIKKISKATSYLLKYVIALIISVFAAGVLEEITDIYDLVIPLSIIFVYFLNYFFNKKSMNDSIDESEETEGRSIGLYIIIALACVGGLTVLTYIFSISSDLQSNAGATMDSMGAMIPSAAPSNGIQSSTSSLDGGFSSIFDNLGEDIYETEDDMSTVEGTTEIEKNTDDNIRKVFLESMCFIPELITSDGKAELDLKLSDNITTWTIQTVGNTKDGRIGYGMLDTVKVFKEFFVDFELPKNLVKTDKVSIPVTVYNYTEDTFNVTLKVKEDAWFKLDKNNINVSAAPESTKMVYIPITILESGNYKFRVEATDGNLTDIVEKTLEISPKGYKVENVVSTGVLDEDISEDILILDEIVEGTANAKVKIYASTMSQNIEGLENIFRMPTGCFEQVSSSLYPNIVALKYMEDNKLIDKELKSKVLGYISSGYQKLLTYEVKGEKGGYSLYGYSPAETVLTAYGLMEFTDLKEVYSVDESVIEEMNDFLYKKQNSNGSFNITGSHIGGASSREKLALNAYIIWALSESDPKNEKLSKSIEYLKSNLESIDDNYTLAIIANILANVEDKQAENVIKRLVNNINLNGNIAYIDSSVRDYYGSYGRTQTIQTVALTSMALTKTSNNHEINKMLINYLVGQKDAWGTWYSTQATVMALKALNLSSQKEKLSEQIILVRVNEDEQKIEIKDNPLEIYELTFNDLEKENKLSIDIEKGSAYYEVIESYYIPYEKVEKSEDEIEVTVKSNNNLKVNETLEAEIRVTNKGKNDIYNGMVTISIPQGFVIVKESLTKLEDKGIIEKYEMTYTTVNLYLRNFDVREFTTLDVEFRASYPVEITGLAVRAYDYYNPEIEGKTMPIEIIVKDN